MSDLVERPLPELVDEILNDDAPNKWVWKTHESQDEWIRGSLLPAIRRQATLIEAQAARIAETEWGDISTAPKDGTEFQAWVVTVDRQGFWEPRSRINPDTGAFEMFGRVDYDEDGWDVFLHLTATHWMPPPEPPTARTLNGGE